LIVLKEKKDNRNRTKNRKPTITKQTTTETDKQTTNPPSSGTPEFQS
jgi:hypothetical protein